MEINICIPKGLQNDLRRSSFALDQIRGYTTRLKCYISNAIDDLEFFNVFKSASAGVKLAIINPQID